MVNDQPLIENEKTFLVEAFLLEKEVFPKVNLEVLRSIFSEKKIIASPLMFKGSK